LFARQIFDVGDGLFVRTLEQVVEQAAQDARMRKENAPKDEHKLIGS